MNTKKVYEAFLEHLKNRELKYRSDDKEMEVNLIMQGDDFPIDMDFIFDDERQMLIVRSVLPVTFEKDKRIEGAITSGMATYRLVNGCFDYSMEKGRVIFRMNHMFRDAIPSAETFDYLIACSSVTVDEYNDKLFMVAKGMLSVEDFYKKINE